MKLFLDTSALVKYFHEEVGTDKITELIRDPENEIWVLDLARIEFTSALFRKYRTKELDDANLHAAMEAFSEEYSNFKVEPLSESVSDEAERLLRTYGKKQGLRTLDALHLGAFVLLAEGEWIFVACDNVLCRVVELEGYKANNLI